MRISALASLAPFALFTGVAALVASIACSNQGEGDYCDPQNGNNDCQNGLTCETAPGLAGGAVTTPSRCCPTPPAPATKAVCMGSVVDAGTPNEVGDAQVPPASDAGADAAADANTSDGSSPDATVSEAGSEEPDAEAGAAPAADASDGASDSAPE